MHHPLFIYVQVFNGVISAVSFDDLGQQHREPLLDLGSDYAARTWLHAHGWQSHGKHPALLGSFFSKLYVPNRALIG